jgi:hypothetical protein
VDGGFFHRAYCRLPGRFSLFKGRFFGGGSCRVPALLWAAGFLSSSRYITGAYPIAIQVPIGPSFVFSILRRKLTADFLQYGRLEGEKSAKP